MSAGPRYTYKWADGTVVTTPIRLPAQEYIRLLLDWVSEQIENHQIFRTMPMDQERRGGAAKRGKESRRESRRELRRELRRESHPDVTLFEETIRAIFKRLFRVYAHVYHSHYPLICKKFFCFLFFFQTKILFSKYLF